MLTDHALEQYRDNDLHWSADLVVALENVRLGLALEWAIECAKSLVTHAGAPESKERLLRWLEELSQAETLSNGSALLKQSDTIWHDSRDLIHTTIAHLYAALAHLRQGNTPRYRTFVIWALNVMGDHEYFRQTSLATPLTLFEQFLAKHG